MKAQVQEKVRLRWRMLKHSEKRVDRKIGRGWKCRTCQLDVENLKCQSKECLCHCVGEGELWEDKK